MYLLIISIVQSTYIGGSIVLSNQFQDRIIMYSVYRTGRINDLMHNALSYTWENLKEHFFTNKVSKKYLHIM